MVIYVQKKKIYVQKKKIYVQKLCYSVILSSKKI